MYIIGNKHTARSISMWDKIITILEKNENLDQTLALCCLRHKKTSIEMSKPDDFFIFALENGCNRKCISRLSCEHACINKCHFEPLHNFIRCLERCQRIKKDCDHVCPKVCEDSCDSKCQIQVSNIILTCEHVQATVLLLRCDYVILLDFVIHSAGTVSGKNLRDLHLSLALNRKDCENLI